MIQLNAEFRASWTRIFNYQSAISLEVFCLVRFEIYFRPDVEIMRRARLLRLPEPPLGEWIYPIALTNPPLLESCT